MRYVLRFLRPYASRMTAGLCVKFLGTVVELFLPGILAHLIDRVAPRGDVPALMGWGALMLGLAGVALVANIWANRMAALTSRGCTQAVRHALFGKILSLSARQIDELTLPTLEARMTSDTYHVHNMVGMMQRIGVRAPILLIGGLILTFVQEPALATVLAAILPLMALAVWLISRRGIPLYGKLQQSVDRLVRTVRENYTGIRVIKALSKTDYERRRFGDANAALSAAETRAATAMALTDPLMNLLLNGAMAPVILLGAFRVNAGQTGVGQVIAFSSYFLLILSAMLAITRVFTGVSRGVASAGRIAGVLHLPEELLPEGDGTPDAAAPHVVFDRVTFGYRPGQTAVADVSFTLRRGETLGVLGETGSGKSTLLTLLLRLYDTDGGDIRIGGVSVRALPPALLRGMCGTVFQGDTLFAGTVAENVAFGRDIPEAEVRRALALAQADFVDALPDGIEHRLTARGTNLSGGQKQRLLIARALAGGPALLLLDDATSALDYDTDARLRRALAAHYGDTTTILITQRVSSIQNADRILVLEGGRAAGLGTHAELLETCAVYREICSSQTGGEICSSQTGGDGHA